jgi:hypothetical protein
MQFACRVITIVGSLLCKENSRIIPFAKDDAAVCDYLFEVPPRGVEVLQNPREIPQSRKIPDHIPDHFGWPPTSEIWFDSSRISRKGNAKPS